MNFQDKLNSGYYSNAGGFPHVSAKEAKNDPAKQAVRNKHLEMQAQRHAEFQVDAFEELGITNHPKAQLLFDKAWDNGHSGGYTDVFNEMSHLVDLIL